MNKLMMLHITDNALPYDAEVEYLESDGSTVIDLGIKPTNNTKIHLEMYYPGFTNKGSFLFGAGVDGSHQFMFGQSSNGSSFYRRGGYAGTLQHTIASGDITLDNTASSDTMVLTDSTGTYSYTVTNAAFSYDETIWIFGINKGAGAYPADVNLSGTRIKGGYVYEGDTLIAHYKTVRKNGVGYLYDTISKTFLTTIGTGLIIGPDYNPFAYQYLTFVPLEDSTFSFSKRGTGNDIEYSIDGGAWTVLASEAKTPTVGAGHNIRWRAELTPSTASGNQGIGTFSASGLYDAMGNTMSLLYGDNFVGQTTLVGTYTLYELWQDDTHIHRADRMVLPATSLVLYCYAYMFKGCTSLATAPELPTTTLASSCYGRMFQGCTSLTTAPELPATTLASSCYSGMFYGCIGLTTPPELPATTLASSCYGIMFQGCTSLTTTPELPATTLASYCYYRMFRGCSSLISASELLATSLVEYCYYQMFYVCSNLTYVKMLATNIKDTTCLSNWLFGVASTGTFVKHSQMTTLPTGTSGIPDGWTVIDDPSTISNS